MNNEVNGSSHSSNSGIARKRNPRHNRPDRRSVFESNGVLGRIRGTADKIAEKYLAHAQDEKTSIDEVKQQVLLQFAEHYTRLANKNDASARVLKEEKHSRRHYKPSHHKEVQPKTEETSTTQEVQPETLPLAELETN